VWHYTLTVYRTVDVLPLAKHSAKGALLLLEENADIETGLY